MKSLFLCAGASVISAPQWSAVKNMVDSWVDLELKQSRVLPGQRMVHLLSFFFNGHLYTML